MTDAPTPDEPTTLATTDPDAYTTLSTATPAPGPGARVTRSAGQAGGVLVYVELWHAFGWAGADSWTADQAGQRWPAITLAATVTVSAVHNLVNWWMARRALDRQSL